MRKFSDKICAENQNTRFAFSNYKKNRAFCEIMWKNMVQSNGTQMKLNTAHALLVLDN